MCVKALDGGLRYEECLAKSIGFINPNNVAHLTAELGLDNRRSFMADLDGTISRIKVSVPYPDPALDSDTD